MPQPIPDTSCFGGGFCLPQSLQQLSCHGGHKMLFVFLSVDLVPRCKKPQALQVAPPQAQRAVAQMHFF